MVEFVWVFVKKDFKVEKLFFCVEEEIMWCGMSEFDNVVFVKIFWVFGMVEIGMK